MMINSVVCCLCGDEVSTKKSVYIEGKYYCKDCIKANLQVEQEVFDE